MPLYTAAQLMTLRTVAPPVAKPEWANLVADVTDHADAPELCGPGLYALFLDDVLFYIGLHVGEQAGAGYPVLHRWVLHVVGQTMRSRRTSFSRASLHRLLAARLGDPVSEGLAACLPDGWMTDLAALPSHPLLQGPHCTAQKAAFAGRNWDVFGPGQEEAMLGRITCLFQPVAGDWADRLTGAEGRERGAWAREQWLRPAETVLVNSFKPACNAAIPLGTHRDGIGVAEVAAAMADALPAVLPAFDRTTYDARVAARRAAPAAIVEAYADTPETPVDAETAELAEAEGMGSGERTFRRRLTGAGSHFVDTLRDTCPPGVELYFTDVPDLRLRIAGERRPLVRLSTANGQFRCATRVDAETCRRIGFADVTTDDSDPMGTTCIVDPAVTPAGAVLVLVGANMTP